MATTWKRVTPKNKCPCCGHDSWCRITSDGTAVQCMRVESPKPFPGESGGWIHKLGTVVESKPVKREEERADKSTDWLTLVKFYQKAFTHSVALSASQLLGVSVESLKRLRTGFDGTALTFPMHDGKPQPIGIRRRFPDASKKCVEGSREGIFVPHDLNGEVPLVVTEGPTDAAAALSIGLAAVGRPSCRGGLEYVVSIARGRPIILIPDGDAEGSPAWKATEKFIAELRVFNLTVRVVRPPLKDLRAYVNAGATKEMILDA